MTEYEGEEFQELTEISEEEQYNDNFEQEELSSEETKKHKPDFYEEIDSDFSEFPETTDFVSKTAPIGDARPLISLLGVDISKLNKVLKSRYGLEVIDDKGAKKIFSLLAEEKRLTPEELTIIFDAMSNTVDDTVQIDSANDVQKKWSNDLKEFLGDETAQYRPLNKTLNNPAHRTLKGNNLISTIEVPLFNTGIRIVMDQLLPREMAIFKMRLASEKYAIVKNSLGTRYSQVTSVSDSLLLDMFVKKIVDCNLDNWNHELLKEIIQDEDLDIIALYNMIAYFPKGYPMRFVCSNMIDEKNECRNTEELKILLSELILFDINNPNQKRRQQVGKKLVTKYKVSLEEVKAYQESEILLNSEYQQGRLRFYFKKPTTAERASLYSSWLKGIEEDLRESMLEAVNENMINSHIANVIVIERLRLWSPYIERVDVMEDSDDSDIVHSTFDLTKTENLEADLKKLYSFMSINESLEGLDKAVEQFIASNQNVLVGYKNYVCPKCKKKHRTETNRYIVPLEVRKLFFTSMERHLQISLTL